MAARIDNPLAEAEALRLKRSGLTFAEVGHRLGVSKPVVMRWLRGYPEFKRERDPAARFWKNVDKQGPLHPVYGQCWVWTGYCMDNGYGQFGLGNRHILAHRMSWVVAHGEELGEADVLHRCDNRSCVRPDHLFLGTQQDNLADMRAKGRQVHGEDQWCAILTEEQVKYIRANYRRGKAGYKGGGAVELARELRVHPATIYKVINGRTWKHV